jgi:hypothetical protein
MSQQDIRIARMTTALLTLYPDSNPGFAKRLEAYKSVGVPLIDVTTEDDRKALIDSARVRAVRNSSLPSAAR